MISEKKTLVSFILLTYNQSKYIDEAINGALEQDYQNIEFIFSDDCSVDDTFEKISHITNGSKRNIILNKNKDNLGLTAHFNKALSMSSGDIIVCAAGDDISLVSRVSDTVTLLNENQNVSFVSFCDEFIDEDGYKIPRESNITKPKTLSLEEFVNGNTLPFSAASRGFRRELYSFFGELNAECPTEDTPYILRGLMLGNALVSPFPAIKYRKHNNNLSNKDNLAKMKHENVVNQYFSDVNHALKQQIIDKRMYSYIKKWVYYFNGSKLLFLQSNFLLKSTFFMKMIFTSRLFRKKIILTIKRKFK